MTLKAHDQTDNERRASEADCRFITIKQLQDEKPLEYVYPPALMIPTRADFLECARNLREAKRMLRREDAD
jgi:hypothetical protein